MNALRKIQTNCWQDENLYGKHQLFAWLHTQGTMSEMAFNMQLHLWVSLDMMPNNW